MLFPETAITAAVSGKPADRANIPASFRKRILNGATGKRSPRLQFAVAGGDAEDRLMVAQPPNGVSRGSGFPGFGYRLSEATRALRHS